MYCFLSEKISVFCFIFHAALWSSLSFSGTDCGSKEGFMNQLASTVVIPDFFPPESELYTRLIEGVGLDQCSSLSLSRACQDHDQCYDEQRDKEFCDDKLLEDWTQICEEGYPAWDPYCRFSCIFMVKIMSRAQRYAHGDFCPSCKAYEFSKRS